MRATCVRGLVSSLAAALLGAGAPAAQKSAYRFLVGDEVRFPRVLSLAGTPGQPGPGDYAVIAGVPLLLEGPGELGLVDAMEKEGEIALVRERGREIVALNAARLATADAATLKGLRGVYLDSWSAAIGAALARVPASAGVAVVDSSAQGDLRSLPPLPEGVQCVSVHTDSKAGFGDWAPAARWRDLRVLELTGNHLGYVEIDLAPFAEARALRVFRSEHRRLLHEEVVRGWTQLRDLEVQEPGWSDFTVLSGCTELRRVHLWKPHAIDLGPLAALPRLESLTLVFAGVTVLPAAGLAALRELDLQGAEVPVAGLRAFRSAHPGCVVRGRPSLDELAAVLASCDRIRVRTGGTCHTDPAEERTIADTRDPTEVKQLVARFAIHEDAGEFLCRCCGSPTFEFFTRGKQVATIGLHHGQSIRWAGGPWTSDAHLTAGSGEALSAWLAAQRFGGPKAERDDSLSRQEAGRARAMLRGLLVGVQTAKALDQASPEDLWATLGTTDAERSLLALRLIGCHEGPWNHVDDCDERLEAGFEAHLAGVDWPALAKAAAADLRVAIGLTSWWVHRRDADGIPAGALAVVLPTVAHAALTHPQPFNRARMLRLLRELPGDAALALLREALAGRFVPRSVAEQELIAPGGFVQVFPSDPVLDRQECSVPALAALCLAARQDTASLPAIRTLAAKAQAADRKALAAALAAFTPGK